MVTPLFYDNPKDENCFINIEHTYMFGDSIKVSPVLEPGVTNEYQSYFPVGSWADLNFLNLTVESSGQNITLKQQYAFTNIHLKAGKIIPYQFNDKVERYTKTQEFINNLRTSFIIYRNPSWVGQYYDVMADGDFCFDDGISASVLQTKNYGCYSIDIYYNGFTIV